MRRAVDIASAGETALILAAERLFAERGIDGVALRQVNQLANQRNMSAAHYHFGSREGLVDAVLKYRLPRLDARRHHMLSRTSAVKDIRYYLEAFVMPLVEEFDVRPEGNYYIRFIQQYARYRGDFEFARHISPAGVEIFDGIERLLCYLPSEIAGLRISNLINIVHSVLAAAEERLSAGRVTLTEIRLIAANTVDMVAAALTAPLSAQTLDILLPKMPFGSPLATSHLPAGDANPAQLDEHG